MQYRFNSMGSGKNCIRHLQHLIWFVYLTQFTLYTTNVETDCTNSILNYISCGKRYLTIYIINYVYKKVYHLKAMNSLTNPQEHCIYYMFFGFTNISNSINSLRDATPYKAIYTQLQSKASASQGDGHLFLGHSHIHLTITHTHTRHRTHIRLTFGIT